MSILNGINIVARASLGASLLFAASGCDSAVVKNARSAESNGAVIDNQLMSEMYPLSFRPGNPQYIERDFEAGANFICDEIKAKQKRDICSESDINWR